MADDIIDLLKIKIENAKKELPEDTQNAIAAVDWKIAILGLRAKKGYTFEQLGDLELETELLLSGLVSAEEYPKELMNRMKISRTAANDLVNEMNNLVFRKIREELVKNIERKKIFARSEKNPANEAKILNSAGIEIIPARNAIGIADAGGENKETLPTPEKLELTAAPVREDIIKKIEKPEQVHPILAQKLSSSLQTPVVKTEHTLDNITKASAPDPSNTTPQIRKIDPYREIPE